MIKTTTIAVIHGTRLRVEPMVPTDGRTWKQRPSVALALGGFDADNSTGVSAVERRHR